MAIIPYVIQTTPRGERGMDIYSRLLQDRIIFVGTAIDENIANLAVAQLLLLKSEDPDKDVQMYINSQGGIIYQGLAIYDTMQYIMSSGKCKIQTICYGMAMSFGTILLAGGAKGYRFALPNSTIHMHQPWASGGGGRQAADIEIEAREILRQRAKLNDILARHTGQPLERIQRDTDRDYFMTAEQAVEYGIIDGVISEVPVEVTQAAG
jgi:ATP-dependent Clp protease protease subunit